LFAPPHTNRAFGIVPYYYSIEELLKGEGEREGVEIIPHIFGLPLPYIHFLKKKMEKFPYTVCIFVIVAVCMYCRSKCPSKCP
jgi:hypothetical protein